MARTVMEDCYLTILEVDGPEWAIRLRDRMDDATSTAKVIIANEETSLLV